MQPSRIDHARQREKMLAESIRGVAADLRLIDLADLVVFLKTTHIASAGVLVHASAELWFKRDTLQFGFSGDAQLNWEQKPQIFLDMEFHHKAVHVYFRLVLEAHDAGVEITYICFDGPSTDPEVNTRRLAGALQEARCNVRDDSLAEMF